jgi:hypothetical protein
MAGSENEPRRSEEGKESVEELEEIEEMVMKLWSCMVRPGKSYIIIRLITFEFKVR